jgi:hypothetical protein
MSSKKKRQHALKKLHSPFTALKIAKLKKIFQNTLKFKKALYLYAALERRLQRLRSNEITDIIKT